MFYSNCGSRYALTWRESPERAWAARAEPPTQLVWHFAAILPRLVNCFLYSFSLFLSKIHWRWRSQLRVCIFLRVELCVERLTGIKRTLDCSGKAEG